MTMLISMHSPRHASIALCGAGISTLRRLRDTQFSRQIPVNDYHHLAFGAGGTDRAAMKVSAAR
jgi:hypothetical protein